MRDRTTGPASLAVALALSIAACASSAASSATRGLGLRASQAEITRENIDVAPDGKGLPEGHGDAVDGGTLFAMQCSRCHGAAIRLAPQRWPYATTLFDYIRRAMPPHASPAPTADQVYALTAYELNMNGLLPAHEQLDRKTLPALKMPGRALLDDRP